MLNYVVSSIAAVEFHLLSGAIVSAVLAVLVIVIGESLPKGPVSDH